MKAIELAKAYDPADFEARIERLWMDGGCFQPRGAAGGETGTEAARFVVVIPPPNVTGVLHLGHGLNMALQDIVVRYHRMRGDDTLWVPGCDHAGIATQNVVERRLRARGSGRREIGREAFVEETWKVTREHHEIISRQIARMGCSVDWSRERFTLDDGLSKAVREVFVTLHERGLLYRGNYLVNWCPSCGTALADDEVEHEDTPGAMYHLRYPVAGEPGAFVNLATTRPETLLGDTAVAVHPADERYAALVGKAVVLPLTDRSIPVIADEYVDRAFGTGVVKITPAHDPNDWEVGKRHGLRAINILTPEGRLNDEVPEAYRGLTVAEARKRVLADLEAGGFFVGEEKITHAVGHCYRCHTVIEPFLSEQWFVRMRPLAEKAMAAWRRGEFAFHPRKWERTFEHWLENIRDWCVSRQLWWGHRIPAWTCGRCGELIVARVDPAACPRCGAPAADLVQDPDVLDTWFSSWLWPFSTLGWPEATADLARFYPTTALVTAYDIIFFWVARMIMAGLEFTGKAPFRDVVIHGLIRDKQGRKMSKSLGNGLDPLSLVDEFGADATKFTLAYLCAQGQDIMVDKDSFRMGSKFANKVWNASRYILMNLEGRTRVAAPAARPVDRWIRSRLNGAARAVGAALESYRFNDAASAAYEFFWNDFCDWYVEATKIPLRDGDDAERDRAATVLLDVLDESLRLLHPLLPFVTEEIHQRLREADDGLAGDGAAAALLITAPYPEYRAERDDPEAERRFGFVQGLTRSIRALRSECGVPPDRRLRALVRAADGDMAAFLAGEAAGLTRLLAGLSSLEVEAAGAGVSKKPEGTIGLAGDGFEAFVYLAGAVDPEALRKKFVKEIERDRAFVRGLDAKLANERFTRNAPAELVEGERRKRDDTRARVTRLETWLRDIEGETRAMRALVVGSGGREHALAWALARSPLVERVWAAPGNGGTAREPKVENIALPDSPEREAGMAAVERAARERGVDLVVVGPEGPLAAGLADRLRGAGLAVVGPGRDAARLESSKAYAKRFMDRYGVRTPPWRFFGDGDGEAAEAEAYARGRFREGGAGRLVIKADGLAGGKGVVIAASEDEAAAAVKTVRGLGAGGGVLIEEFVEGVEVSVLAAARVTGGEACIRTLLPARDHKRRFDGGRGPNTGGMGAVAPAPGFGPEIEAEFRASVLEPTLRGIAAEGLSYTGFLFFGLMVDGGGRAWALEYNVRLGDPETQAVLPLMESDFAALCAAIVHGGLAEFPLAWKPGYSCAPVAVVSGYPGPFPKGASMVGPGGRGLPAGGVGGGAPHIFVGGADESLRVTGGRVFTAQACGSSLEEARARAYGALEAARFEGMDWRRDIGC